MITTKQRAQLRSMANGMDAIFQIGKGGIGENLLTQLEDALRARELIKLHVLESCELTSREAANVIAEKTGCDVVQVIGSKLVLYKRNRKEPKIQVD